MLMLLAKDADGGGDADAYVQSKGADIEDTDGVVAADDDDVGQGY